MRKKVNRFLVLLSAAALLLFAALMLGVFYQSVTARLRQEQKSEAAYIRQAIMNEGDALAYLRAVGNVDDTRLTLIAPDGTVRYDSMADASRMENHAGRPEVAAALATGEGISARPSDTLGAETLYYAVRLPSGEVLRLADTQASVWGVVVRTIPGIVGLLALILLACTLLARSITKMIVAPLNALDLSAPLDNDAYDEISPLLSRLEAQRRQIEKQMKELTARSDEFGAIADNMREGLLVLNAQGSILSINRSGQTLFHAESTSCVGKHVLTLDRSLPLKNCVELAAAGSHAEGLMQLGGRSYQLIASPVRERGAVTGIVLLILDVTEREERERMRREFSANVSHELKTPLTSISGYAEIIKNGIVQPADIPVFASRIYDESTRLMALVEDIIRLSRLDEGAEGLPFDDVDLYALANSVEERLRSAADTAGVSLSLGGAPATVRGVRQVLEEIVYNLTDNGIRYNKPGGSVSITVTPGEAGARLRVADTGIGIPPEHQSRVFERFYRVDQSHSRETGGTGLGLAIVKRGALLHGAGVSLESAAGKGTTVTVVFPREKRK